MDGSMVYAMFAGAVVLQLFPPPFVSGLSTGRGLDLRGTALIVGAWIGGGAGVITTLIFFVVSKTLRRLQPTNKG
jgi:hypothetical protein